jgi:hypothetical protein
MEIQKKREKKVNQQKNQAKVPSILATQNLTSFYLFDTLLIYPYFPAI